MSTLGSVLIAILMMQLLTYFWRFRQCQLNFMPFASALHAAVAFSRATLSALDSFAAAAGVGTTAMPLTSTVAIMPAIKGVAKWYMIPSIELGFYLPPRPSHHIAMVSEKLAAGVGNPTPQDLGRFLGDRDRGDRGLMNAPDTSRSFNAGPS